MPFYLLQWSFKDPQIQAMTERPHNREEISRKAVEAYGGKLYHYFFAFGEYDGLALVEFPDHERCVAHNMTVLGAGALSRLNTTMLFTAQEAQRAMERAGTVKSGYTPPVGYDSHG